MPTLRDYWRIIWLRKWIVVAVMVLCSVGMFLVTNSKPRVYEATARLMYEQPLAMGSVVSGVTATDPNSVAIEMQSAVGLIGGPEVARRAQALLGGPGSAPHYKVTATVLPSTDTTASTVSSTALGIAVQSPAARASAAIANAFALALIGLRKEAEIAQVRQAESAITSQMRMFVTPKSKETGDYVTLSQQLRSLQILAATTSGDFVVVAPAVPPSAPISPRPRRSAAMGLGVGLFAGIALAFILSQFDTRVRTARELSEELGLTLVGRVPRLHGRLAHDGRLVARDEPDGRVAEALRSVRSALDYANPPGEVRSLLFTSSHAHEGKTTIMCSLGETLARAGKHVIVVDADMRRPRVHEVFQLPNDVGLSSVVAGHVTLRDALKPVAPRVSASRESENDGTAAAAAAVGGASHLVVLTSGPLQPNPGELVASSGFEGIIRQLAATSVDYVLVDSPPFRVVGDAGALAAYVDGLLLVVDMHAARVPALEEARQFMQELPCKKVGVIAVGENGHKGEYAGYGRFHSS